MTTAVAAPPVTAPLAPPPVDTNNISRTYAAIAPSNGTPNSRASKSGSNHGSPSSDSPSQRHPDGKRSPNSNRNRNAPKIIVKKEPPSSPEIQTSRHRPRRLDLSNNMTNQQAAMTGRPSAPLTAKESAGLAIHDVGLACLSPGFHTQDPSMREQLQRSIDVREQQRQIIEARQKTAKGGNGESSRHGEVNPFRNGANTPGTSRRKGPPPGLSIAPPSHAHFANERVIQSAPLNQSFTGLRTHQPLSRQVANQPSSLSQSSHIHHVPANQTNNRLPPISDVFPGETLGAPRDPASRNLFGNPSPGHSSHSNQQPPLPSPGFPPQQGQHHIPQTSGRPREYKSAEEAVQSMSGGREDLLPRIVHYGGHQPPTPPSPMHTKNGSSQNLQAGTSSDIHRSGSGRRRGREEYERDMGTPPLGRQAELRRVGPFGEGRDSPDTQRKKKEEFIQLCSRAWDLFHS